MCDSIGRSVSLHMCTVLLLLMGWVIFPLLLRTGHYPFGAALFLGKVVKKYAHLSAYYRILVMNTVTEFNFYGLVPPSTAAGTLNSPCPVAANPYCWALPQVSLTFPEIHRRSRYIGWLSADRKTPKIDVQYSYIPSYIVSALLLADSEPFYKT